MKMKFSKTEDDSEIAPVIAGMSDDDILVIARQELTKIIDPELGIDVISLGLIYDIYVESVDYSPIDSSQTAVIKSLIVDMTLTTPGCPVAESLPIQAREYLSEILGSQIDVQINIVWDPPWSPEKMDLLWWFLSCQLDCSLRIRRRYHKSGPMR